MENKAEYIGNYRIRYKGEVLTVPVDRQGKLYLPDGKALQLTDEQFAIVCQKIEEKRAKDALAKPMTMPTAEELSYLHTKKPTPETPTEKPTDKMLDETTAADTHYNNAEVQASKKAVVQKEKSEKRAAMEAEKAKRKAETEEARAEKKMAKEAAQAKKTAAEEEERRKKEEAREAAKKAAQEKKAEKARVREEKRASTNQTTKLSLFVAALASALITIILIGGLFFYFVNSGFITINSSPRINGLVIYDDVVSGGAAGVSPIANCFTL